MTDWPQYESHKIVRAAKIVSIGESTSEDTVRVLIVDPHGDGTREPFECSQASMHAAAQVGWYAITYPDGFRSASPSDRFEEGYTPVQP